MTNMQTDLLRNGVIALQRRSKHLRRYDPPLAMRNCPWAPRMYMSVVDLRRVGRSNPGINPPPAACTIVAF